MRCYLLTFTASHSPTKTTEFFYNRKDKLFKFTVIKQNRRCHYKDPIIITLVKWDDWSQLKMNNGIDSMTTLMEELDKPWHNVTGRSSLIISGPGTISYSYQFSAEFKKFIRIIACKNSICSLPLSYTHSYRQSPLCNKRGYNCNWC